jgi:hypothetical protein
MPMSGTPIGLPGPPHVPLGVPAGLQRYTIANHTRVALPEPERKVRVDVKERPGQSYPRPVDHVRIVEGVQRGGPAYHQPHSEARQRMAGNEMGDPNGGVPCPYPNGASGQPGAAVADPASE